MNYSIVSANLTIQALRDSGYKDTAHAIAELIDNSVEAGASLIEIVAVERRSESGTRYARSNLSEIAVVDNGHGMDVSVLRRSLRFGDGTRLNADRKGIGRFGIGLPQSSISQGKRVDIWTWTNGSKNALHCHLDIDEIEEDAIDEVPEPQHRELPVEWSGAVDNFASESGTLVVWSKLDRVKWRTARTLLDHIEELSGRIYRRFLTDTSDVLRISFTQATETNGVLQVDEDTGRRDCLPNDPLYQMTNTSTPAPFDDRPMFQLFNERTWKIPIEIDGKSKLGRVFARCSFATVDAVSESKAEVAWPKSYANPGDAPWGKHANRNLGVSLVRADRELEMSTAWSNKYDPTERWWSIEVDFDPVLDEIFGVVNNKQHAHNFVRGADFSAEDYMEDTETYDDFVDRLRDENDPDAELLEIWNWMKEQISRMRSEREKLVKGAREKYNRHENPSTKETVEDVSTVVIQEQVANGEKGESDTAPKISKKDKVEQLQKSALNRNVPKEDAKEWSQETVNYGRKIQIKPVSLGHEDAFFDVESVNDVIVIWLNQDHPVYTHLLGNLEDDSHELAFVDDANVINLLKKLKTADFALYMVLIAWARYEDKLPIGMKDSHKDIRMDWGREARRFLNAVGL